MQLSESLSRALRKMYDTAPKGDKSLSVLLFGIHYAKQIGACGSSPNSLASMADIPHSYGTEIRKGIRLSEHVVAKAQIETP